MTSDVIDPITIVQAKYGAFGEPELLPNNTATIMPITTPIIPIRRTVSAALSRFSSKFLFHSASIRNSVAVFGLGGDVGRGGGTNRIVSIEQWGHVVLLLSGDSVAGSNWMWPLQCWQGQVTRLGMFPFVLRVSVKVS
jgi:hypothetical protein